MMRLNFTRSDLVTFALGALAAALVPLGAALAQLDNDPVTDYGTWAMGLLTGIGAALGRYLVTAVPAARVAGRAAPAPPPARPTVGDALARKQPPGAQGS